MKITSGLLGPLIERTEGWREAWLRPLLVLFRRCGISANALTVARLALAVPFPWLITSAPTTAWWLISISIAADALDGAVARFTKADSDRGKFIDVVADHATFVLFCLGSMRLLPELSLPLAAAGFAIPFAYLICSVAANERRPSDWIIHPEARLTGYKIVFIAIVIAAVTGYSNLESVRWMLWTETAVASIYFAWRYILFIRKKF